MAERMIPWWMGYLLISPIRKLRQKPEPIITPYVHPGFNILEIGPGMGYFTIPMAQLTGTAGKVYCVDVQEKMLAVLMKRVRKYNLDGIVEPIKCSFSSLNILHLANTIDFALLFAVIHEVPNPKIVFREVFDSMKTGAKLLFAEPTGHVTVDDFKKSTSLALKAGFQVVNDLSIYNSHAVLLEKK